MRAHPLERQALIEEPVIARRWIVGALAPERAVAEEPERAESIVGRDDDGIVLLDESRSILCLRIRRTPI